MPHGDIETFHKDGNWYNAVEGTDQVSEPFEAKEQARSDGREMARELGVEHVIKGLDGQVHERNTYGHDPHDIPG